MKTEKEYIGYLLMIFGVIGFFLSVESCSEKKEKTINTKFITEVTYTNGDVDTLTYVAKSVGRAAESYLKSGDNGGCLSTSFDASYFETVACGVRKIKVLSKSAI